MMFLSVGKLHFCEIRLISMKQNWFLWSKVDFCEIKLILWMISQINFRTLFLSMCQIRATHAVEKEHEETTTFDRCNTIRYWILDVYASRSENDRTNPQVPSRAHLRSHFLRIITRFLSRASLIRADELAVVALEKMISQWKRERMENECGRSLFSSFFFPSAEYTIELSRSIRLLPSLLDSLQERERGRPRISSVAREICI